MRCELDAAFFHLYMPSTRKGEWAVARVEDWAFRDETDEELNQLKSHFPTPRDAVAYIMETFPIVKRKDEQAHGHYRTKDTILSIYDDMQRAIATGIPYQTRLDPPPADPRCCHPESTRPGWAKPPGAKTTVCTEIPESIAAEPDLELNPQPATPKPETALKSFTSTPTPTTTQPTTADHLAQALNFLRTNPGPHSRTEILTALNLTPDDWPILRDALNTNPNIQITGQKRGTRYEWNE